MDAAAVLVVRAVLAAGKRAIHRCISLKAVKDREGELAYISLGADNKNRHGKSCDGFCVVHLTENVSERLYNLRKI